MADLTLLAPPTLIRDGLPHPSGLKAGEALTAGNAVYIASDGTVMKSITVVGTAIPLVDDVHASFDGVILRDYADGEGGVTIFGIGSVIDITSDTLTIGGFIYCSLTAGKLGDADASLNGELPVAKAFSATAIEIVATHGDLVS